MEKRQQNRSERIKETRNRDPTETGLQNRTRHAAPAPAADLEFMIISTGELTQGAVRQQRAIKSGRRNTTQRVPRRFRKYLFTVCGTKFRNSNVLPYFRFRTDSVHPRSLFVCDFRCLLFKILDIQIRGHRNKRRSSISLKRLHYLCLCRLHSLFLFSTQR